MGILDDRALPTELLPGGASEIHVGPSTELEPGQLIGVGQYAVGNFKGTYFAVSRSCRHLAGDLAKGSIDAKGCVVCPLHGARYDAESGQMVRGPRGIYAKVPGLEATLKGLTKAVPLKRRRVVERDGELYLVR